jgi:site-specific recombinase XerD
MKAFLAAQKDCGAAEKTIIGYQSFLRLLSEGLPTKINVHEITDKRVREHVAKYEKPASRNATIRHLRAFFRWTCKRGWREGDPTEQIDKTRQIDDAIPCACDSRSCGEILKICFPRAMRMPRRSSNLQRNCIDLRKVRVPAACELCL